MNKRNDKIWELYKKGVKKAQIARIYKLSRERVGQIIKGYLTKRK